LNVGGKSLDATTQTDRDTTHAAATATATLTHSYRRNYRSASVGRSEAAAERSPLQFSSIHLVTAVAIVADFAGVAVTVSVGGVECQVVFGVNNGFVG